MAGAGAISVGIVLAFALLRPRNPRAELQLAEPADRNRGVRVPARLAVEEQAA